jgi:hypothetical protein
LNFYSLKHQRLVSLAKMLACELTMTKNSPNVLQKALLQPTQLFQLPSLNTGFGGRAPFADGGEVENALRTAAQRRLNQKPLARVSDRLLGPGKAPEDKLRLANSCEARRLAAQRQRTRRAEGGTTESDAPLDLGCLGDAIGNLIGGGDRDVVSKDQPAEAAAPASNGIGDFFDRWSSNPLSQFLFAAGLGTMASDRVNPIQAIGQGATAALPYFNQLVETHRDLRKRERQRRADLDFSKRVLAPDTVVSPSTEPTDTPTPDRRATTATATPVIVPVESAPVVRESQEPANDSMQPATKPAETVKAPTSPTGAIDKQLAGLLAEHRRLSTMGALADNVKQRTAVSAKLADVRQQISSLQSERYPSVFEAGEAAEPICWSDVTDTNRCEGTGEDDVLAGLPALLDGY